MVKELANTRTHSQKGSPPSRHPQVHLEYFGPDEEQGVQEGGLLDEPELLDNFEAETLFQEILKKIEGLWNAIVFIDECQSIFGQTGCLVTGSERICAVAQDNG